MVTYSLSILIALVLYLVWKDVREKAVPLWAVGCFALLSLFQLRGLDDKLPPLLSFLMLLALCGVIEGYFRLRRQTEALGIADLVLLSFSGFWMAPESLPTYLIFVGSAGILTGVWWRYMYNEFTYPFAPAICGGVLFILWIGSGAP